MESRHNYLAPNHTLRDNRRKCSLCARTFSKTEHLDRHIRSHTKEKPFECQPCGRKYGRHDSLLRHIKDHHKDARRNDTQNVRFTTISSKTRQRMITDENGQQTEENQLVHAQDVIPVQSDVDGMPTEAYDCQLNQLEHPQSMSGEAHSWNQNQTFIQDSVATGQPAITGFENWLTNGNLDDSFLQDWPFVTDDPGISHATNDTRHSNGKPLVDLQQIWYTHLDKDEPALSGYTTPRPGQELEVDDNYRKSLQRRLQIRSMDQNLPSAEFLNLCVRAYFKSFHPVFPVIHAPTFRPSKANSVLLLSICSIGSLLTGYPSAIQRGIQLFERLNKAILSNWEILTRRSHDETLAMIQASLLGQTFGLLSGQAKHLVLVDTFHGTIVAWARRLKVFQAQHRPSNHIDLENRWRDWARTEEKIRLALAVRIHDAEIANTLQHEIFLPLSSKLAPISASDALFFASSPHEWMSMYREIPTNVVTPVSEGSPGYSVPEILHQRLLTIPVNCYFAVYSTLEDISSSIMDARINETLTTEYVQELQLCLVAFQRQYLHEPLQRQFNGLWQGNRIFWHLLFISLHSDQDLLEKSIGRDGSELDPSDLAKIQQWAKSSSAKRCVAHTIMILRDLEHFPLIPEPGMHVPRATFLSAVCLFCYSKYGDGLSDGTGDQNFDFPEFQLLDADVSALLREANACGHGSHVGIGPLCGLIDSLQRTGHWEISRKFASILEVLVHTELS